MPILLRPSPTAPRLIGACAAALVLAAAALVVLLAPWRLPRRVEDAWRLPVELEFPEIAQRIFRKIERHAPRVDPEPPASDAPTDIDRPETRAELLERAAATEPRRLDERAPAPVATALERPATPPRPGEITIPARDPEGAGAPRALDAAPGPTAAAAADPAAPVGRGAELSPRSAAAPALSLGPTARLLDWMRRHPAAIEPQVETFLLSAGGRAALSSRVEIQDRGRPYALFLAAIVDSDHPERSELRVGLLDRRAGEIARLVDPELRGALPSLKVGEARVDASGRVAWVDADPRSSDDGRWHSVFLRWFEEQIP